MESFQFSSIYSGSHRFCCAGRFCERCPRSFQKARIPIAEKPVSLLNGLAVDAALLFKSDESRNQRDKRAAGKVKIGYQRADVMPLIWWVNEYLCLATFRFKLAIAGLAFQNARRSGAHGNDSTALALRTVQNISRASIDRIRFFMHLMLLERIGRHG